MDSGCTVSDDGQKLRPRLPGTQSGYETHHRVYVSTCPSSDEKLEIIKLNVVIVPNLEQVTHSKLGTITTPTI